MWICHYKRNGKDLFVQKVQFILKFNFYTWNSIWYSAFSPLFATPQFEPKLQNLHAPCYSHSMQVGIHDYIKFVYQQNRRTNGKGPVTALQMTLQVTMKTKNSQVQRNPDISMRMVSKKYLVWLLSILVKAPCLPQENPGSEHFFGELCVISHTLFLMFCCRHQQRADLPRKLGSDKESSADALKCLLLLHILKQANVSTVVAPETLHWSCFVVIAAELEFFERNNNTNTKVPFRIK